MYQDFIGIDIGKQHFYVGLYGQKETHSYTNTLEGFKQFLHHYQASLPHALLVLETTGGYEKALIAFLQKRELAVHRAHTKNVKRFIQSYGKLGKSDAIDALGLAHYAHERHQSLALYTQHEEETLRKLVCRRNDLKQMIVQEKNRLQAPDQHELKQSFKKVITLLEKEKKSIEKKIEKIFTEDKQLKQKKEVLQTVSGIGDTTAKDLIALLPELGRANRKQIASLAGVAPHPNESGRWIGHRFVRGGRITIKPVLYMAAMAASRSKSELGQFYQSLVKAGKKKMVALTALMRKIIVIANARLRDFYTNNPIQKHS